MDWTQIVVALIGLLAGGGLMRLATLGSTRRKANAQAKGEELKNKDAAVAALEHAITALNSSMESLQSQVDRLMTADKEKDETIARKDAEIAEAEAAKAKYLMRLQALYDDMCVHKGCKLRKPHQGMGGAWYESHSDDPNLGSDFLSVETLLRRFRKEEQGIELKDENSNNSNGNNQ